MESLTKSLLLGRRRWVLHRKTRMRWYTFKKQKYRRRSGTPHQSPSVTASPKGEAFFLKRSNLQVCHSERSRRISFAMEILRFRFASLRMTITDSETIRTINELLLQKAQTGVATEHPLQLCFCSLFKEQKIFRQLLTIYSLSIIIISVI